MDQLVGFRLFAVALFLKPEVAPSGFSYMCRNKILKKLELKELKGFFKSFKKKRNDMGN